MATTVTVVEPNPLLCLGILNLLQSLDCTLVATGIDYAQLFRDATEQTGATDLMLLSVPGSYERMVELISAAQQGYAPRRILLLSDTHTLPYSLLNLPSSLAGYISKYSSQDVLKTSIMLVLAGGKCFPPPDIVHPARLDGDAVLHDKTPQPKRRWYDRHGAVPAPRAEERPPDSFLGAPKTMPASAGTRPSTDRAPASEPPIESQAPPPRPGSREARMLRLTPRQYEVLVLLAKGYPLKKISRELNISVATAKTHTEALYQRLSVNSSNAAVYAAISKGATLGLQGPPLQESLPPAA
ncbi:LuxR C-terminal-related transcriptional regulator [uncultured Castellaniella sp.]|uniref:response regulator transcription factor n=1 Tax=uncultured Castellaniella sp. TaxID=647907 RepID=UPI00260341C9|nr:LuxR C-terminal-related transcriptional regulator [uncultured Castellaniella sp.]